MKTLVVTDESQFSAAEQLLDILIADKRDVTLVRYPNQLDAIQAEIASKSANCVVLISPHVFQNNDQTDVFLQLGKEICQNGNAISATPKGGVKPEEWNCSNYSIPNEQAATRMIRWIFQDLQYRDVCAAISHKGAGNDPPPASAPRKALFRALTVIVPVTLTPIIAVFSLFNTTWGVLKDFDVLRQPSAAQEKVYRNIGAGQCNALRSFIASQDDSVLTDQAKERLNLLELRPTVEDETNVVRLPLYLFQSGSGRPSESSTSAEAKKLCEGLVATSGGSLERYTVVGSSTSCELGICEVSGEAECTVSQPIRKEIEWCP